MKFRDIFGKGLQTVNQYIKKKPICTEGNNQTMGPAKMRKTELKTEESEIVIDIDRKGACNFKIMSKVESAMQENSKPFNKKSSVMERLRTLSNACFKKYLCAKNVKCNGKTIDHKSPHFVSLYKNKKTLCDKRLPPTSCYVALDCEFVGVLDDQSALGRCSIVDFDGKVICDIYARPLEKITTYRTRWSGITKNDMAKAIPLESALSQISDIIKDKIVVGHALHNDFKVLGLRHSGEMTRDTSICQPLRYLMNARGTQPLSLKKCAYTLLGKNIQTMGHCSIIDAQTAMDLYKLVRKEWEEQLIDINKDSGDNNGCGLEGEVEANDAKKEQNLTSKAKNADCIDENDSSVDKIKPGKIVNGDVKNSEVPEGNSSERKVGQKRKLPDSFDDSNQIINGDCQHSVTDRSGLFKDETNSVSSCCSDLNKDVNISSSFECCKGLSSQDSLANICSDKVTSKQSKKKKKYVSKHISLASGYSRNVKHLFHDTFWEDQDQFHHYGDVNLN